MVYCLPGFLLVVRPAGGSFFGGSPYGPVKEISGLNMSKMTEIPRQPRLSVLEPISVISKQRTSKREK